MHSRKFKFQNLAVQDIWLEEASYISQQCFTLASWLMLKGSSKGWLCSSHSIVNSVVYLCAKFGALNPRIHKGSGGNWFWQVPQVQTGRFSIPMNFWLSNLVTMIPRTSGTVMNSSLHVSSHLYASQLQVMEQAETEAQSGKFIKEYVWMSEFYWSGCLPSPLLL
jgi:hypothetical protein